MASWARLEDLAPQLYILVSKKRANKRSVIEALSVGAIADFLKLWDLLSGVQLQAGVMDKHVHLSSSGQYTAKSAYDALFQGAVSFGPWEQIWKSWAPAKLSLLPMACGS